MMNQSASRKPFATKPIPCARKTKTSADDFGNELTGTRRNTTEVTIKRVNETSEGYRQYAARQVIESAQKSLEIRVKDEAKRISSKYIRPPHTTDFAILFLPTERLFAKATRMPGLVIELQ